MGRKPKLTTGQIAEARQMLLDGETISATARRFGVTRQTIRRGVPDVNVRRGGTPPVPPRILTDEILSEAWDDAIAGESLASIADRIGVCYQALQQGFRRAGYGSVSDARLSDTGSMADSVCPHGCGRTAGHLPADAFAAGGVSLPACQGRRAAA